jgi:hypothetical protein
MLERIQPRNGAKNGGKTSILLNTLRRYASFLGSIKVKISK